MEEGPRSLGPCSVSAEDPLPSLRVWDTKLDVLTGKLRTSSGREAELTAAETKLLHFLMTNAGRVMKREELIGTGRDGGHERSYFSLASRVCRLRGKIEEDPADPWYIRSVKRAGYTVPEPFPL